MYYVIRKVHSLNNELTYTPIGYVLTLEDSEYIHDEVNEAKAEQWLISNYLAIKSGSINPASYFDTNPPFYIWGWDTLNVDGMNISLITDLDHPEGM